MLKMGGKPKSAGAIVAVASAPMRGWPIKPLPAPTSSTWKLKGRVFLHQAEGPVHPAVGGVDADGRRSRRRSPSERRRTSRYLSPESSAREPRHRVSRSRHCRRSPSATVARRVIRIPDERPIDLVEAEDAERVADVRHLGDDGGVGGIDSVGARRRRPIVALACEDAGRQLGQRRRRPGRSVSASAAAAASGRENLWDFLLKGVPPKDARAAADPTVQASAVSNPRLRINAAVSGSRPRNLRVGLGKDRRCCRR